MFLSIVCVGLLSFHCGESLGIVVGWPEPYLNTVKVNPLYIAQYLSSELVNYCALIGQIYMPPGLTLT